MKVNNKKNIIVSIIIVSAIGIFFIWHKDNNVTLDEVSLKKAKQEKGMFAIMLQSAEGSQNYIKSEEETWPESGYTFNSEKSGCLDSNGQKILDVELTYDESSHKVNVKTLGTSYCYIYFDKEIHKASDILEEKVNQGGLKQTSGKGDLEYRYVGTQSQSSSVDNYVCFGADDCAGAETNDHMYRIIGITSDGNLKIQKSSAVGTEQWWPDYKVDNPWSESKIYLILTGISFYGSDNYVTESMKSKIETEHTWNTGDVGENYSNGTDVYNSEYKTHTHTGAVGLAYLSDYYFAYDEGGTQDCNSGEYCKSWMVPSNYQKLWSGVEYEYTMTRFGCGKSNGSCCAWVVAPTGFAVWNYIKIISAIRPVFYLKSTISITSGNGTLSEPYIIN